MFGDFQNLDQYMGMFPWVVGATAVFIILFIFAKFWRAVVAKNIPGQTFIGMTVQDIDKMRRDGIISAEEYKTIRHKAAERELESIRHKDEADRERLILAEVELDPEAARKLLKPEQLAEHKPAAQPQTPPEPAPEPEPAASQPTEEPKPSKMYDWGDPLAQTNVAQPPPAVIPNTITHPQPGKIRVPPPQAEPRKTETPGELELLLQKGAITREDYERFKAMTKK